MEERVHRSGVMQATLISLPAVEETTEEEHQQTRERESERRRARERERERERERGTFGSSHERLEPQPFVRGTTGEETAVREG